MNNKIISIKTKTIIALMILHFRWIIFNNSKLSKIIWYNTMHWPLNKAKCLIISNYNKIDSIKMRKMKRIFLKLDITTISNLLIYNQDFAIKHFPSIRSLNTNSMIPILSWTKGTNKPKIAPFKYSLWWIVKINSFLSLSRFLQFRIIRNWARIQSIRRFLLIWKDQMLFLRLIEIYKFKRISI